MTSGTNVIFGTLVVFLAMPLYTGLALATLLTMLDLIGEDPRALAEAIPVAVEIVLVTIP